MSSTPQWTNKTFTIRKTNHTYAYVHQSPSNPSKPTLLFLHGFPSTSYDWRLQFPFLTSHGYGVLAPDLLGYGSSSKPTSVEPYIGHSMASDIISLLDHENIKRVVGVGHDWGTYLLSQLIIWFPKRVEKCVFVSVPFHVPGRKTDVKILNEKSKREVGFEVLGYWMFLTKEGAGEVIADNWETFYNIIYCTDPSLWKTHFAPLGAMEHTLKTLTPESSSKYLAQWASSPISKAHHKTSFLPTYAPATNWYHRALASLGVDEELSSLKSHKISSKINIPTLMITGTKDVVCNSKHARVTMNKVVEEGKLDVVDFEAGHWVMLEKGEGFNEVLGEWLEKGTVGRNVEKAKL